MAQHTLGFVLGRAGRFEEAVLHIERAMQLSPRDIFIAGFLAFGSAALFGMGNYEKALKWAQRATRSPNPRWQSFSTLAASLIKLGKQDEATIAITDLLAHRPTISLSEVRKHFNETFPNNLEGNSHYVEALREAGLPE